MSWKGHTIGAMIPARAGSVRIPDKNIRELGGKALVSWSIDQALAVPAIDRIALNTDDPRVAAIGRAKGVEVIDRPAELATDTASTLSVMQHTLRVWQDAGFTPDLFILLQATSPLRGSACIDNGIQKMVETGADSLFGVRKSKFPPHWLMQTDAQGFLTFPIPRADKKVRSQDQDLWYEINGALYIYRREVLENAESYAMGTHSVPLLMTDRESVDIDEPHDLEVAECLIRTYDQDRG